MNQELKDYLVKINMKDGFGDSDDEIRQLLTESEEIFREHLSSHRWWETWRYVSKIGDKFISYEWAQANRDESIFDIGWEFDWDSVVEVKPVTRVVEITEYVTV